MVAVPTPLSASASGRRVQIMALADQCVMCGLCIPQCPTYRIARQENESPRGRIALARALASNELPPSPALMGHLDQCLGCMSCASACPSEVDYAHILEQTRALQQALRPASRLRRALYGVLTRRRYLNVGLRLARLPGVMGLVRGPIGRRLMRRAGLAALVDEMPQLPAARVWPERAASVGSTRGRIGLFLGCVASAFDQEVHAAAITLLTALGYEVVIPPGQGCCGALPRHAGLAFDATPTRRAFGDSGVSTVLVSASGCFGSLRDEVFADGGLKVSEIHAFLAADAQLDRLAFRPLAARAAVHTPCTQANVAKGAAAITALLGRIPGLHVLPLPTEPRCCGAAGSYFLEHPDIAVPLRAEKLAQTRALAPDLLLTSNIGCRLYLDNGLGRDAPVLPVLHPLVLLAQQLEPGAA